MKTNILTFLLALTFLLFFSSSVFGQKPEVKNENTSKDSIDTRFADVLKVPDVERVKPKYDYDNLNEHMLIIN